MHSGSHNFISLYVAICWVIIKISSYPWNHINWKKIKMVDTKKLRFSTPSILNISWIGPWVHRKIDAKGIDVV